MSEENFSSCYCMMDAERLRAVQMQNYLRKKEQKEQREKDLRQGLQLYK